MIQENINSLRERVSELNKLLNVQSKYRDTEYRRGLTHELDRALYKYYKALLSQMRSMEGNGDGI